MSYEELVASLAEPSTRTVVAGQLMWGQAGRSAHVADAFSRILAEETDEVLRERAAVFWASGEMRRGDGEFGAWEQAWRRRVAELVEA